MRRAAIMLASVSVLFWTTRFARAQELTDLSPKLSCPAPTEDIAALLSSAKSLFLAGRLRPARQTALCALEQSPGSPDAMYLLGYIEERDGEANRSLDWFTKAAAVRKPSAEDLRIVGLDYALLDDYPDAIHWLERSVQFDPKNAETWYDLGRSWMTQGDSSAAEKSLKQSLRLQPESVKAENNLGVTYETENRADEAVQAYRQAIAWQEAGSPPKPSEQPYLNLGTLLNTQQRGVEAVPLLEKATSFAPANAKAHEQLARALEQSGSLDKAVPEMALSVKLDNENARLHFELGQMYRRARRPDDARRELLLSGQLYGTHSTPINK